MAKIFKIEGCWNWTRGRTTAGYGLLSEAGGKRRAYAHRPAYGLWKREIPREKFIVHKCDNPSCCSPRLLFAGTHKDNIRDRDQKNRVAHGENHCRAKLRVAEVKDIRAEFKAGKSARQIAVERG